MTTNTEEMRGDVHRRGLTPETDMVSWKVRGLVGEVKTMGGRVRSTI